MIGSLSESQMDIFLRQELVGRIGCVHNGLVYVVPTSYVYDGRDIYAHSEEGMKVNIMRKNPQVCFEVDDLRDMNHWQSVISWGYFEELTGEEDKKRALHMLMDRKLPVISSITTQIGKNWPYLDDDEMIEGIFYRIRLERKTGKYEANTEPPSILG